MIAVPPSSTGEREGRVPYLPNETKFLAGPECSEYPPSLLPFMYDPKNYRITAVCGTKELRPPPAVVPLHKDQHPTDRADSSRNLLINRLLHASLVARIVPFIDAFR